MLDEIDYKILESLKRNARISYTAIAREIGISEAAIRKRINKLMKEGIIQRFTIEMNLGFRAITFVSIEPRASCIEISKKILGVKGVERVYEISGEYDIAVVISTKSYEEANKVIDEIRSLSGVQKTYTVAVLGVHY